MIESRPDLQINVPVAKGVLIVGVELRHGWEEDFDAWSARRLVDNATAPLGNDVIELRASGIGSVVANSHGQFCVCQPDDAVAHVCGRRKIR